MNDRQLNLGLNRQFVGDKQVVITMNAAPDRVLNRQDPVIGLAALPAVDPRRLAELARDERPAVQEAALRALGQLDAGQGEPVPTLGNVLDMVDKRCRLFIELKDPKSWTFIVSSWPAQTRHDLSNKAASLTLGAGSPFQQRCSRRLREIAYQWRPNRGLGGPSAQFTSS